MSAKNDEEKLEVIEDEKKAARAIKVNLYKNKLQLDGLLTMTEMLEMSHKDFVLFIESVEAQHRINELNRK